jgi:serine/threonine protein kinase
VLTFCGDHSRDAGALQVKIMQSIDGPHNIVRLLAVCTDQLPLYMIMEFAARGDLKGVLKHARPRVTRMPGSAPGSTRRPTRSSLPLVAFGCSEARLPS